MTKMVVYVVWYFDDAQWCVDGVFKNSDAADKQVENNKRMGCDSYVDPMELVE
jgi:hypothetical protein